MRQGPFGAWLLLEGFFVGVARRGLEAVDGVFGQRGELAGELDWRLLVAVFALLGVEVLDPLL